MQIYFLNNKLTALADRDSSILLAVREALLHKNNVEEAASLEAADVILIQEEKTTYKNFRYIDALLGDAIISKHLNKIFTINTDDSSTGLLRGVYTSIPKSRFKPELHRVVPYFEYPNPLVFEEVAAADASYLGGWCGNTKSNNVRKRMVEALQQQKEFCIRTSQSWFNHQQDELSSYVKLIRESRFSLCPAGWADATIRIYESMALGRCPVIIADNFVPPAGPAWKDFALFFPEKKLAELPAFLQKHASSSEQMGAAAKEAWDRYFGGDLLKHYYADTLLSLILAMPAYTKEEEVRRWRSFSTYWNNKWSVPQRIMNKVKKVMKS